MNENNRARQTKRFLKWIRKHPGRWYLICAADNEQMNFPKMKSLIEQLAREQFYEMIFVLLMVHRNAPFMKNLFAYGYLDMLIAHWDDDREEIIRCLAVHFE